MSLWTDVIAFSPTWVDAYPEKLRRFITTVAEQTIPAGVVGVSEPELACYGVLDVNGKARQAAGSADLDALYERLADQARKFEQLDSDATGEYEPPTWTEDSDEHIGPYICVEGARSKICQTLASVENTPFAEVELSGLSVGDEISKEVSLSGGDSYLDLSELNVEVGPSFAKFMDDAPEFAGWLRVVLCGEGQPYPLGREELLDRVQGCEAFQRIINFASECFGVKQWSWTVACTG